MIGSTNYLSTKHDHRIITRTVLFLVSIQSIYGLDWIGLTLKIKIYPCAAAAAAYPQIESQSVQTLTTPPPRQHQHYIYMISHHVPSPKYPLTTLIKKIPINFHTCLIILVITIHSQPPLILQNPNPDFPKPLILILMNFHAPPLIHTLLPNPFPIITINATNTNPAPITITFPTNSTILSYRVPIPPPGDTAPALSENQKRQIAAYNFAMCPQGLRGIFLAALLCSLCHVEAYYVPGTFPQSFEYGSELIGEVAGLS